MHVIAHQPDRALPDFRRIPPGLRCVCHASILSRLEASGKPGAVHLAVVDAVTGTLQYEIPDPQFSWGGWSMDIAPVLGASNNMITTQGGRLLSFDLAGRAIGWSVASGFSGTPALAKAVIYVKRSGQIEARRESDGALLWT